MKKALLLLASAALLFAGCAKEHIAGGEADGSQVTVTFTTNLTTEGSKATLDNDGHAAKVNHWVLEVRDAQNDLFIREERDVTAGTLQQTYELKLFKNQSYTLQFWADTKGAYNTDDLTAISTVGSVANVDSRDAFSANVDYTSLVSESKSVTLYRPFAQLNIITLDLDELKTQVIEAAYEKYAPSDLKVVAEIPTTFNVQTQTAGEASEQTLTAAASYADFLAGVPETTLFMDYIFASKESADVVNIAFDFTSNSQPVAYNFTNIPLQRNYRTNIKGQLLSNDSEWNVTIDPEWETPEYVEEVWSAGMITPVTPEDDVYTINLPSELAWIAQQVNNGETFAGKTVKLAKDIDLNNGEWTPIGKSDVLSFKGTFEGNGKTIKNLNINLGNSSVNAGLFSFVNEGTVSNFTVDGAKVSVVGGAAGVVAGKMFPGGLIEKVTVKNAELNGCRQIGGIVGSIYGKVKNCTAENVEITATPNLEGGSYDNGDKCGAIVGFSTFDNDGGEVSGNIAKNVIIKGYRDIGGIVGAADCSKTTITGNQVHGAELTADQTVNFYGKKDYNVGAVVGRVNAGTVDASNTSENVIVKTIGNAVEKALDEALPGETVTVPATAESFGTINVPANLADGVTLVAAEGAKVDDVIIPDGADIKDLTIRGFNATRAMGVALQSGFVTIMDNAKVENLVVEGCEINGQNSRKNDGAGICVKSSTSVYPKSIIIKNCVINQTTYGFYCANTMEGVSLAFDSCSFNNCTSWDIMVNNKNMKSLSITNCQFTGGTEPGDKDPTNLVKVANGTTPSDFTFTFVNNTVQREYGNVNVAAKASQTTMSGNKKNGVDWTPSITILPE